MAPAETPPSPGGHFAWQLVGPEGRVELRGVLGSLKRHGEWVVPTRLALHRRMGSVDLDLTRARFAGPMPARASNAPRRPASLATANCGQDYEFQTAGREAVAFAQVGHEAVNVRDGKGAMVLDLRHLAGFRKHGV